jgi:hypothetical protein
MKMEKLFVLHQRSEQLSLKGPFDLDELKLALKNHTVVASDFIYRPGRSEKWKRIFESTTLKDQVFTAPSRSDFETYEQLISSKSVSASPARPLKEKMAAPLSLSATQPLPTGTPPPPWFFKFEDLEYGPFSTKEISGIIGLRRLGAKKLELWNRSTGAWFPASELTKFASTNPQLMTSEDSFEIERSNNKRAAQRSSKLATAWAMIDKKVRLIGICTDLSDTGVRIVYNAKFPLKLREKIRLFIDASETEAFWVVSQVVRIAREESKAGLHFDSDDDLSTFRTWLRSIQKNY